MEMESERDGVDGVYEECYPSWNKHLLPILESLFPQPSKVEILVPACGESEMSLKLYDAGYEHITNIDSSRDVIRKMLKLHVNQPTLLWRVGDITDKLGSKPYYDVVIDKGALDGLTSSEDSYLNKVKNALKLGGKFISLTHFNRRAKALLLEVFSMGFRTTFHDLPEDNPATMMVTERVNFLLPYLLSIHDDKQVQATNPLLYQAISNENAKRQRVLDEMSLSVAEIESGVMGDPNVISIGRSFMVDWTGEAGLKYEVLVLDVKPPRHCFSWDIFFVPKLTSRLLDLSEPERLMICSHAQASRVYVVLLPKCVELLPTNELLRNFDMLFSKLAPQGSEDTVSYLKLGARKSQNMNYYLFWRKRTYLKNLAINICNEKN
ncbi:uncharacterized protein [Spinacia oleracea]|uniref:Uncharacterized protein isoform X2 n=1 Tax=Spinacia oleracea TaxID=3562 RepID=A0ABM3R202_SPIOL|nr:uncharacterized protein LOC110785656 isoform X2 [Spinacia oleracea]